MNAIRLSVFALLLTSIILAACSAEAESVPLKERVITTAPRYESGQSGSVSLFPSAVMGTPVVEVPRDNFFQNYGVNTFIDTSADPLSTFALDVDTASYTIARRYVRDGLLPPTDAIRVEEFVNYFNQEYPIPPDVAFAIYADGARSPFHADGTYFLRIGIQGYEEPASERPRAALTFVIDVSGSMEMGNRLGLVKQALEMLVDGLRLDDTVAIVVYGSDAHIALWPTSGSEKETILYTIRNLRPLGSTNAQAGLLLGYQMASRAYLPDGINRVILASDGVANVGLTDPDLLAAQIRQYSEGGIALTTVGVGMGNFNDVLMEQLADQGNGNYAYVDTLYEAQKLFVNDLTSTLQTIARDAKVQVEFNPEIVNQYRLIGYENRAIADRDFRDNRIDAGEIGAGHSATALYAIRMKSGTNGRIATVRLRWEDPEIHRVHEVEGDFNTWDLSASFDEANPRYQLAVTAAQYAELLRHSYWAGDATYGEVAALAQELAVQLFYDEEVAEFAGLLNSAAVLRQ